MKITILCSSQNHPIYPCLVHWIDNNKEHSISLKNSVKEVESGDILFLISCSEIVKKEVRDKFRATLVVHASDLPKGRGWSPYIWKVIEGANKIPVTLLEAEDKVDSGKIWNQLFYELEGHELYDEMNQKLFDCTFKLMNYAIDNIETIQPKLQRNEEPSYYRKRNPEDSKIDINKSIEEQFNLLRVADPNRYPSFFEHKGHKYKIMLEKM
jgi:methionyl-tRNA formyltransferase